jgi:hypothetical protein
MTRIVIAALVALVVSGPAWADEELFLRCEKENSGTPITTKRPAPKILFISEESKNWKEVFKLHTEPDTNNFDPYCSENMTIRQSFRVISSSNIMSITCHGGGHDPYIFVMRFELDRFTGIMTVKHWPEHMKEENEAVIFPDDYLKAPSQTVRYKCVSRQF